MVFSIETKGIRVSLSLVSVFCIVVGLLISENAFDEGLSTLLKAFGLILYVLGWVGVSIAATMTSASGKMGSFLKNGLPALMVMVAAMISMVPLFMSTPSNYTWIVYLSGVLYSAAWLWFAIAAGYRDGTKFDSQRGTLFILGALLVTTSMPILFNYRKFRIADFTPTNDIDKIAVYNPGLVMFAIGWGLVTLGLNKK